MPLTKLEAERELWNWHQNWFDDDNCNADELHLRDAFDAIEVNGECVDEDGHNQGWSLGHYDEYRQDPDAGPYGNMLEVIKQTYQVGPKTYKVLINAIYLRNHIAYLHTVHRRILHLLRQPARRSHCRSRHL